jgi:alkaline phosphatase
MSGCYDSVTSMFQEKSLGIYYQFFGKRSASHSARRFCFLFSFLLILHAIFSSSLHAKAKNILLFIGDGMGPEQIQAGGYFLHGSSETLSFELFPMRSMMTTRSANNAVTRSDANNGIISIRTPGDGSKPMTILEYFKNRNARTGLVTNSFVEDATPAAFGAHNMDRDKIDEIADDYIFSSRPSILFGVGKQIALGELQGNGYEIGDSGESLEQFSLFPPDGPGTGFAAALITLDFINPQSDFMAWEHGREDTYGTNVPSLKSMTDAALRLLKNQNGFFVMIENENIDSAGHGNHLDKVTFPTVTPDFTRSDLLSYEMVAFSSAVQTAVDWVTAHDLWNETLIIVTGDHECGNLQVEDSGVVQGAIPTMTWGSGDHTGIDIPVYARGAGSELLSSVTDNADIFSLMYLSTLDNYENIVIWDGNGANNNWGNPNNWFPQRVPLPTDNVLFNGRSNKACTVNVPVNIKSLTMDTSVGPNTIVVTLASGPFSVSGDVNLFAGTFQGGNQSVFVGGNWAQGGITVFNPQTSTVTFNGVVSSSFTGSTQFYGLASTVPLLTFPALTTQFVSNMVGFENGALRCSQPGFNWYIQFTGNVQKTRNVDVQGSDASGGNFILAFDSTGIDSTVNWKFTNGKRYWLGVSSDLWDDPFNWGSVSGGEPDGTFPEPYDHVIIDGANNVNMNVTMNVPINIATLTISGTYSGTVDFNDSPVTLSNSFVQNNGHVSMKSSLVKISGDFLHTGGTFSSDSSTIVFTGEGVQKIQSSGSALNHVMVEKTNAALSLQSNLTLLGNLTMKSGVFFAGANNYEIHAATVAINGGTLNLTKTNLAVSGNLTKAAAGNLTRTLSMVTFEGANNQVLNIGSASLNSLDVNKNNGVMSLVGNLNLDGNFSLKNGVINPGNNQINVDGNFTVTGGNFNAGTSAVTFTGSTLQNVSAPGISFHHLISDNSAAPVVLKSYLKVLGNLTVKSGTFDFRNSSMTLSGNFIKTGGTLSRASSTITFEGNGNQSLSLAGGTVNTLIVDKSGGAMSIINDVNLDGDFILTNGTVNAGKNSIKVKGNWQNDGTGLFNADGSTVTFNGGTGVLSRLLGPTTFYGLTSTTDLQFGAGTTQYILNMLNFSNIDLRSSIPNQWWWIAYSGSNNNQILNTISVKDSDASLGMELLPNNTSTGVGINPNWTFVPSANPVRLVQCHPRPIKQQFSMGMEWAMSHWTHRSSFLA